MRRTIPAVLFVILAGAGTAQAGGDDDSGLLEFAYAEAAVAPSAAATLEALSTPRASDVPKRGALLPVLYVGLVGLNGYDAYSTKKGVSLGAIERNPLMQPIAGHAAAVWAVKGGVTAASITVAERLWRRNRRGAAITMLVVTNAIAAAAAARNAQVLGQR